MISIEFGQPEADYVATQSAVNSGMEFLLSRQVHRDPNWGSLGIHTISLRGSSHLPTDRWANEEVFAKPRTANMTNDGIHDEMFLPSVACSEFMNEMFETTESIHPECGMHALSNNNRTHAVSIKYAQPPQKNHSGTQRRDTRTQPECDILRQGQYSYVLCQFSAFTHCHLRYSCE